MDEHRDQHPAADGGSPGGPDDARTGRPGGATPGGAAPGGAARTDQPGRTAPDDEALARLRAADPAAGSRLDADALRAEVARRVAAEEATGAPDGVEADAGAAVVPLEPRRRSRWLQVAAVAAAAAVVAGAGGYALGTEGGADAVTAGAPITLSVPGAAAEGAMKMDAAGSTADMRIAPWFGGRAVFTASGLADDAGSGHAWAFDAASVFSAETAARVAGVLGVPGDPVLQYGAWTVGSQDGSGPSLSLQPDGTAGLSYFDPTRDPWSCTASAPDQPGGGATSDGAAGTAAEGGAAVEVAPTPEPATLDPALVDPALPSVVGPSCDPAAGPAPTGDAATSAARDLIGALGVDPDGFQYEVVDTGDARSSAVTAYQVLDGQQTGLTWSVTLVADGVQSLYGSLAPLVDLGEYPVVGAATAVERLNDPRFGAGFGGVMPLARAEVADDAAASSSSASADPTVPPTARPGAAIPWAVQQVTITGARLGVSQVTGADGSALLVPAYELSDAGGSTWSVVAVDEGSLDLAG
ncbi:hypothetical protein MHY85_17860 [Cellulomonas sp. ACRRI]|uniref:hypothetical protein n=1 Tax=Cellulomonas sp. ACRRI TaxID=2918188 RepID=UPI001EF242EC|nr:hypothetical protein [Cellulomonas sp. ACRRI]MCG7287833.1 hypothetical protein [Cellulomonas sp. ACRRI]